MSWSRTRTRPLPPGWRSTRARILSRDPHCRLCGIRPSTEVDHIVARSAGGTDHDTNLRGLCAACHAALTRRQAAAARTAAAQARRAARRTPGIP